MRKVECDERRGRSPPCKNGLAASVCNHQSGHRKELVVSFGDLPLVSDAQAHSLEG